MPIPRHRHVHVLVGVALLAVTLTACSGASIPTCAEFAGMSPDTGLLSSFTSEQSAAVRAALDATGYDDGAYNQTIARTEILSYCNIYDGVANQNQSSPITEAVE